MNRNKVCSALVLLALLVPLIQVPLVWDLFKGQDFRTGSGQPENAPPPEDVQGLVDDEPFSSGYLSESPPVTGTLDPALVEQTGYATSGSLSARTDTGENTAYDLPIDKAHSWMGSNASVSIWNLTRLYAVNGTFDDGIPGDNPTPAGNVEFHPYGWDSNSTTSDSATIQNSSYVQMDSYYVAVQNEGKTIGPSPEQRKAQHADQTEIMWMQTIDNAPYSEDFVFSTSFLYRFGPIDVALGNVITLIARIEGTEIWSISLPSLASKDTWYNSGDIVVTIPGADSFLMLEMGLKINATIDLFHGDYGVLDATFLRIHLDDVRLIGSSPPAFDSVDLQFSAGGYSSPVTGSSGNGGAWTLNSSFWMNPFLTVSVSSNTSVSFDLVTRLLSHRFTDSSWRPDPLDTGVAFTIEPEVSAELQFYMYIGYFGDYEDPTVQVTLPEDWENATVFDSFLSDVTSQCTITKGLIEVSGTLLDRTGWWQVDLNSPNYARSIVSEIHDDELGSWAPEAVYRIGNTTRAVIEIGTATQTPASVSDVNVTWYKPGMVYWASELLNGSGELPSSSQLFAAGNSPAGEWLVDLFWTNGTEVAHGEALFELVHRTSLVADPPTISTYKGLTITGIVRFTDVETGSYLMDDAATMIGVWPGGVVSFAPNAVRNWWEVQLDTSLVGAGQHLVNVTVTRQYYDTATCQILVDSYYDTRLSSPNSPWTSMQWGEVGNFTFFFEMYDYSAGSWQSMDDAVDLDITVNWTDGFWTAYDDSSPGIYLTEIDTSAKPAGTYLLNVTFTKDGYESGTIFLTLIVSPMTSSLVVAGSGSARVDIDEMYEVTVTYLDQSDNPISSADVVIDEVTPSSGLDFTTLTEVVGQPGNYSIQLTPRDAGVFTVRFVASNDNAQPASTVFVLVVNDVDTQLVIDNSGSAEIGLTDTYSVTFRYEMLNGTGIDGASIEIVYTGPSLALSWGLNPIGSGDYEVEFSSTQSGTYLITVAASKQYYQSASDAFFLIVREISTEISVLNGTADLVSFGKSYRLLVEYKNGSGYGLDAASVTIEGITPATGLSWSATTPLGGGLFEIVLDPQTANTFTMIIRAAYSNHQTQFTTFTLTATAIATSLTVLNVSTSISVDRNLTVYLFYQTEDFVGIENATVSVQNPPAGIDVSPFEDLGAGYYMVTLTPLQVGVFDMIFRASIAGYQSDTAGFTLGATRIPTKLRVAGGLTADSMVYGSDYELLVFYERTDEISTNISAATLDIQLSPATGISTTLTEVGEGYMIEFTAERVGRWTLSITAEKEGYALSLVQFVIDVDAVRVDVEVLSRLSAIEGQDFEVRVLLTNADNGNPITGADVEYRITATGGGNYFSLEETETPGVYSSIHTIGVYTSYTVYTLEIRLNLDNHEIAGGGFTTQFFKDNNAVMRAMPIITGGGSIALVFIVLVVGYRISSARRKRKNLAALQVKKRFDDVSNILGVIVLHKKTGLPLYSKILRGGFDEAMVSAFVTAITHFRSEFGMDEKHWEFNVIPISDIISAIPTRNLIVAFITVQTPSQYQEISMEAFGRATGAMFDDMMADARSDIILPEQRAMFDNLFYDLMDGFLLENFRLEKDASFPKAMNCLESTAIQLENDKGFKLDDLAKGMATCGIEESRAYKMVMDAIERRLIRVANGEEIGGVVKPFIDREKAERDKAEKDSTD